MSKVFWEVGPKGINDMVGLAFIVKENEGFGDIEGMEDVVFEEKG